MATKKLLIYTALASTLLGGTSTYVLIHNKIILPSREINALNKQINSLKASEAVSYANNPATQQSVAQQTAEENNITISSDNSASVNYNQQDTQGTLEEGAVSSTKNLSSTSINAILNNNCKIGTQKGYKLIKPMLWAKPAKESQAFAALKTQLIRTIESDSRQKLLTSASVYLYSFADGDWTYINPNESFNPGSLIKVPMLITYLEMAEKDPKIMNKKILCENNDYIPTQTYETHAINPGRTYTVRELLHSMIAYSDNNATNLLNKNADLHLFRKAFTDLNIPEPNLGDREFQISAKRYSRFLIVLYNASYLSRNSSELALRLLSECDFKEGMVKELPTNIPVAHKFGEWGDNKLHQHVLSESGIVYYNDKPYLLTVMTKGTNVKNLAPEISKISKMTYDYINSMDNSNL